jgi:hypothetical protein
MTGPGPCDWAEPAKALSARMGRIHPSRTKCRWRQLLINDRESYGLCEDRGGCG